jgi:hypothetical protein
MNIICIREARDSDGDKIMNFTKGVTYTCNKLFDPIEGIEYAVKDDNGKIERFWNINIMFEQL